MQRPDTFIGSNLDYLWFKYNQRTLVERLKPIKRYLANAIKCETVLLSANTALGCLTELDDHVIERLQNQSDIVVVFKRVK